MVVVSLVRLVTYNLFPARCPECDGWLSPLVRRTAPQVGIHIHAADPRASTPQDWLHCRGCGFTVSFDLAADEA